MVSRAPLIGIVVVDGLMSGQSAPGGMRDSVRTNADCVPEWGRRRVFQATIFWSFGGKNYLTKTDGAVYSLGSIPDMFSFSPQRREDATGTPKNNRLFFAPSRLCGEKNARA
jgi:hypothetical protein